MDDDQAWEKREKGVALHDAMLEAAWKAMAAWGRYLDVSTAAQQRGLDLLEAYRWMRRHLRLVDLQRRYQPPPWERGRLPKAMIAAIERRVAGVAEKVLALDSLSGPDALEKLRGALQLEGRERGPKESRANALSRSASRHAAEVIGRLVRGQDRYLAGSGRIPLHPTVEDRLDLVADAHSVSVHTVRRAWAAARGERADLQALHERAISNQREIRNRQRAAAAAPAPPAKIKTGANRAKFKAAIDRDMKGK